mgnify:CR=1 FL=1
MLARFGPAGNSEAFSAKYKTTLQAPGYLEAMGLDHYEYQCGRGVRVTDKTAFALRDKACVPVASALLLSAAGDAAGAVHDFLLQMFLFALAHVAYIRYFLPSAEFSRRRIAAAAVVGAGLLLFLFAGIVPRVASSVERTGVALYGTVIAAMLLSVLFYRGRYAPGFRVAALFFVFSDATIAWNKFVEPLPDATLRIMSTYYAAQYLFALLALAASSRKAAAARP